MTLDKKIFCYIKNKNTFYFEDKTGKIDADSLNLEILNPKNFLTKGYIAYIVVTFKPNEIPYIEDFSKMLMLTKKKSNYNRVLFKVYGIRGI